MLNSRVYVLAFGTFTVGTEGYVIAGVLPAVAHDLHTSISVVGQLVTIFALVYAVAGPLLIGALRAVRPRQVLIGAAVVFAAANLLAALSPNAALLVVARILAAIGAALFMAPAASTAAALAPPEYLSKAIAVTATGNAIALTLGAPLGTLAAMVWGWRAAFVFVTVLAVATACLVAVMVPDIGPGPATRTRRRDLIGKASVRWSFATTFLLFMAAYTVYTYLSPITTAASGRGSDAVAILMAVFGAGGLTGGVMIGRVLEKRQLAPVLRTALSAVLCFLVIVTLTTTGRWASPGTRLWILAVVMYLLGTAWWCGGVSQQTRFALLAPSRLRDTALSLHYSAQFLGVAAAGALGGLVLARTGPVEVALTAAVLAACSRTTIRRMPASAPVPQRDATNG